jgi:hypothetical protein
MAGSGSTGLNVLGGTISTNTTRTSATEKQAESGDVANNDALYHDQSGVAAFHPPRPGQSSQTGHMSFVEAVRKVII